jgi:hypothetical protein
MARSRSLVSISFIQIFASKGVLILPMQSRLNSLQECNTLAYNLSTIAFMKRHATAQHPAFVTLLIPAHDGTPGSLLPIGYLALCAPYTPVIGASAPSSPATQIGVGRYTCHTPALDAVRVVRSLPVKSAHRQCIRPKSARHRALEPVTCMNAFGTSGTGP